MGLVTPTKVGETINQCTVEYSFSYYFFSLESLSLDFPKFQNQKMSMVPQTDLGLERFNLFCFVGLAKVGKIYGLNVFVHFLLQKFWIKIFLLKKRGVKS